MAALENYGFQPPAARDDPGQGFDLASILGIVKRRYLYFAIPFLLVALAGYFIIKALPKVYRAQGEILLEVADDPSRSGASDDYGIGRRAFCSHQGTYRI